MASQAIRIVVADDHAILRAGLRSLLAAQRDLEVVGEATDGTSAIERATEHRPDVILLDITMPGMNGIDAISRIRAASPNTRILILTMHDDQAYLRSVLAAGGAGYLVKRAADAELVAAIRAVHEGRSYIDVSLGDGSLSGVLNANEDDPVSTPVDVLSDRERQVLEYVALGYTHREVAELLTVSIKTVETYRSRLAEKLGIKSRAELVRYAMEKGLLAVRPNDDDRER